MCGIVGVASRHPVSDRGLLVRQRDVICHRGPDDAGLEWYDEGRVGFAHRRLSIIDLSPTGHQPMTAAGGALHIVYNGEIYNYREVRTELAARGHAFVTQSDTEVILEAYREWGPACVEHLNGMFAIAIYDAARKRVVLARDRAGEKPLFYARFGDELWFASELKALLMSPRCPRKLSLEALDYYLAFGYVPGELCILEGVHKLPAANTLTLDLATGEQRMTRYWELPEPFAGPVPDIETLTDELEGLLEDAVRLQLVADVPVGVLLSGGVDSSLVTAFAARASSAPIRTFNIAFPDHGAFDEGPFARMVAAHFGTQHTELVAEPATVSLLPALARQYDEPIADSSMIPTYLVSKLVRENCSVALGGDGGDELFGGYSQYPWMLRQQRLRQFVPRAVGRLIAYGGAQLPVGFRGRTYMLSMGADSTQSLGYGSLLFDQRTRERLVPALRGLGKLSPEAYRECAGLPARSALQRMTRSDFMTYLPDDILVKVDRASMMTSLEVRAPLLDHRLVSFAFGRVPDHYRATLSERKILLRRLAARVLPSSLDLKRKQGFSVPLAAWFKGDWGTMMESVLHEASPALFDQSMIQRLLDGQRKGFSNSQRLFSLTVFELWRREYQIELP